MHVMLLAVVYAVVPMLYYCCGCPAENGSLCVAPVSYKLPGTSVAMIHDIAVTDDYYVVVVGPLKFNPGKVRGTLQHLTFRILLAKATASVENSSPLRGHVSLLFVASVRNPTEQSKECSTDLEVCCVLQFLTQYMTSQCSIAECLMYEPEQPTKVHLVPRPRGAAGVAWLGCC